MKDIGRIGTAWRIRRMSGRGSATGVGRLRPEGTGVVDARLTDRYVDYPTALVRLSRINPDALGDLLGMAGRFVTSSGKRKPRERG